MLYINDLSRIIDFEILPDKYKNSCQQIALLSLSVYIFTIRYRQYIQQHYRNCTGPISFYFNHHNKLFLIAKCAKNLINNNIKNYC
jgi:hypothetical protein